MVKNRYGKLNDRVTLVAVLASLTLMSLLAAAQAAPPTVTAAAVVPERTTSSFGDWTVTCTQPAATTRRCEAGLTIQDQAHQTQAVLAIGRLRLDQPLQAIVRLPVDIRTATPVTLTLDGNGPVAVPFQFCNPSGCYALLDLTDGAFTRRMRDRPADTAGRIEWHASSDTTVALPLSTRGFAAAMDDLTAEAGK